MITSGVVSTMFAVAALVSPVAAGWAAESCELWSSAGWQCGPGDARDLLRQVALTGAFSALAAALMWHRPTGSSKAD